MKKHILSLSVITSLFLATQVKAQSQAKMYQDANTLIENLLKDPSVSAADKEILKETLKTNNEALKALKSDNTPVYSTKPIKNTATNNTAPAAVQPRKTPTITGQSNNRSGGRTLISSNAN